MLPGGWCPLPLLGGCFSAGFDSAPTSQGSQTHTLPLVSCPWCFVASEIHPSLSMVSSAQPCILTQRDWGFDPFPSVAWGQRAGASRGFSTEMADLSLDENQDANCKMLCCRYVT